MTNKQVINMIDDYLSDSKNINAEWVEALLICKQALLEKGKQKAETLNEFVRRFKEDSCWVFDNKYAEDDAVTYIDNLIEEMIEEEQL